jgi:adenylyl cyclase-associated protein
MAKKPDMTSPAYMEVLKDLQEAITKTDEIRELNRASPMKDHLAMVADSIGALGWIMFESTPKPADYVGELFGGAQMFGNKVLQVNKDKSVSLDC